MHFLPFFFWLSLALAGDSVNDPIGHDIIPCVGRDSVRGVFIFTPGCSGTGTRGGNRAEMRYNKLGLRDHDYPPKAPHGITRVLILGPSVLTGPGVEESFTIPRLIEGLLKQEKRKVEVINGSTEGYFTVQAALRLRDYLEAYSPDLVIFKLAGAHAMFYDLMAYRHIQFGADGAPESLGPPVPIYESGFPAMLRNFILADSTRWRFDIAYTAFRQRERFLLTRDIYPYGSSEEDARIRLLAPQVALLKYMRSAVEKAHGKFVITWDPTDRLTNHYNESHPGNISLARFLQHFVRDLNFSGEPVGNILRANGLPVTDAKLLEVFSPAYTLKGDYHLTAEGCREAAKSLLAVVRKALPTAVWRSGGSK